MKKIVLLGLLLCSAAYGGFETPREQQNKRISERLIETNQYIKTIIGKTAWYNSAGCATDPIYANKGRMSYNDAAYNTENKYVPISFLEADINQDTYRDDIIFKVKIDKNDDGYIKTSSASPLKISDGWGCFKANNPQDKDNHKTQNVKSTDVNNGWDVSCRKDAFNGSKVCTVSKGGLMVLLIDGRYVIGVGKNHYPGSSSAIKIDDNVPYLGKEGIINPIYANLIVKQMKDGKKAVIRYREWPYDYNIDTEIDLIGFSKKLNEMLERYRKQ